MKKRLIALLLAGAMVFCNSTFVFAEEGNVDPAIEDVVVSTQAEAMKYISPEDAVDAAANGTAYTLDVRLFDRYTSGRITNSLWCPQFPLDDTSLDAKLQEFAKANFLSAGDTKPIHIVCNAGASGAQRATNNLLAAGVSADRIFTIEGGANALQTVSGAFTTDRSLDAIDWKYVEPAEAVKVAGTNNVQVLDVRAADVFAGGHLKGSEHCSLATPTDAELQKAFKLWAEDRLLKTKPIYITCYSGNKCAKTAISILKDLGYDTNNIFIIRGGANELKAIEGAFVTYNYVSPLQTDKAAKDGSAFILNVRTFKDHTSARIPNSYWCPQFPMDDTSLDTKLQDYATANFADSEKPIYVICNSGQSGAVRATNNLIAAGIPNERIFTVTGGGKALAAEGYTTTNRYDDAIDWKYTTIENASADLIIDVRNNEARASVGFIPYSLQCDLTTVLDADLQNEFYEFAKEIAENYPAVEISILCYSGNKCAKTAISIFKDLGVNTDTVKIIEGGAKANAESLMQMSYQDIDGSEWFYPYVEHMFVSKIMTGVQGGTLFAPYLNFSRSQLAVTLYRLSGDSVTATEAPFIDAQDEWYRDAVTWAKENGIITGYTNSSDPSKTVFLPDRPVSRQETVTMLYRFANYMGCDTSIKADLNSYPDASSVASFAKEAMQWSVAAGLIQGNNGKLDPEGISVRAIAATILTRFDKAFLAYR